ncbi:MAG: hypothetical protein KA052_00060 [Candidatus Pacebacteria bacterium]|nr:hypothetical protein [Candidatus Paceibacterota bacterium]
MNSENNSGDNKHVCHLGGGMCGSGCGCKEHHLHVWRWFLKIALVVVLLCFTYQLGMLRGMLHGGGYRGYDKGGMMYRHQPMMYLDTFNDKVGGPAANVVTPDAN